MDNIKEYYHNYSYSDKDDMKEMYRDGVEVESIADAYGCSVTTVRNILKSFPNYDDYLKEHRRIITAGKYKIKKLCKFDGCNRTIGHSQDYCVYHSSVVKNKELKSEIENKVKKDSFARNNNIFIRFEKCDYFAIFCGDIVSLVDNDNYDLIIKHSWYLSTNGYLCCRIDGKVTLLHRLIMSNDKNICLEIDHINLNKLDNRKENLRIVTPSQNQMNRDIMSNNTSGYTGVTWDKSRNKWKVTINENGNCHNLGRFDRLEDAVAARNSAEKKYHSEYAYKRSGNG